MIIHPHHRQVHGPPNKRLASMHSVWAACVHSVYPWMAWIPSAPISGGHPAHGHWTNPQRLGGSYLPCLCVAIERSLSGRQCTHFETSRWLPDHRPVWIRRCTDRSWSCIPKQGGVGTGCRFALSPHPWQLPSFKFSGTSFQILSILLRLGPRECLSLS